MELQVNENKVRPWATGGIEQQKNLSSVLVFSDVPTVAEDGSDEEFLSLRTPLGPLVPDPEIKREKYGRSPDGSEVRSLDSIHNEGKITKLNDSEFYDFYGVFSSLSIQDFKETNSVISKIHQNFSGLWNVFFFGTKPKIHIYSGVLLDYQDFPYYQQFSMAFDRYISGRASTQKSLKTKIMYDNKIASGFLLDFSVSGNAANEKIKRFSLVTVIYDVQWLRINTHRQKNKNSTGTNLLMNKGDFITEDRMSMNTNEVLSSDIRLR